MRVVWWVLALAVAAALLAGCGGGDETETAASEASRAEGAKKPQKRKTVAVTIDGYANPENVGLLMAEERGYFADAGFDVDLTTPVIPPRPLRYLAEEVIDLAVSHEPQVARSQKHGLSIVTVAGLLPQPTAAMIWLKKSGIGDIADLKGKTIAYEGLPFQEGFLRKILARAGLTLADVKVVDAGYEMVPDLISGRADAIFGGSWNVEGVELESRGLEPVVTRVEELGIPPYEELVLAARRESLAEDPEWIRDFVDAAARGTEAAIEDPEAATEAVLEGSAERDPDIDPKDKADRKAAEATVEATLPLLEVSVLTPPAP
jgi:putative hydroxymethylpyrimidine transport system substrate-binding protein